jgi:hypothetical protein
MKWILMVLVNVMVFSAFAQECSWDGMGDGRREEVKEFIIQRTREKLDTFLIEKGIVKISEDPFLVEVRTKWDFNPQLPYARFHYKFRTQRGSEISTDAQRAGEFGGFRLLNFNIVIERDVEGNPIKKICYIQLGSLALPLYNLTADDYLLVELELFEQNEHFRFELPVPSNWE